MTSFYDPMGVEIYKSNEYITRRRQSLLLFTIEKKARSHSHEGIIYKFQSNWEHNVYHTKISGGRGCISSEGSEWSDAGSVGYSPIFPSPPGETVKRNISSRDVIHRGFPGGHRRARGDRNTYLGRSESPHYNRITISHQKLRRDAEKRGLNIPKHIQHRSTSTSTSNRSRSPSLPKVTQTPNVLKALNLRRGIVSKDIYRVKGKKLLMKGGFWYLQARAQDLLRLRMSPKFKYTTLGTSVSPQARSQMKVLFPEEDFRLDFSPETTSRSSTCSTLTATSPVNPQISVLPRTGIVDYIPMTKISNNQQPRGGLAVRANLKQATSILNFLKEPDPVSIPMFNIGTKSMHKGPIHMIPGDPVNTTFQHYGSPTATMTMERKENISFKKPVKKYEETKKEQYKLILHPCRVEKKPKNEGKQKLRRFTSPPICDPQTFHKSADLPKLKAAPSDFIFNLGKSLEKLTEELGIREDKLE